MSSRPERRRMSSRPERLHYFEAQSSMFSLPRPKRHEMSTSYYDDEMLTGAAEVQVTRETSLSPSQEKDIAQPTTRSIYSQPHWATLMLTLSLRQRESSLRRSLSLPELSTSYYDDMLAEPTKESTYRPDKSL